MNMLKNEFLVLHQEGERQLNSMAQTEDALAAESETTNNAMADATEGSD